MKNTILIYLQSAERILILLLASCLFIGEAFAQQDVPQPHENRQIDFTSTPELIVYIAIPVLAILLYLFLRKKRKRDRGL